jgi:hypothetical protein
MAWSSKIFSAFVVDSFAGTALFDLDNPAHVVNAALYADGTPSATTTSAQTANGSTAWGTTITNVLDSTSGGVGWPAVGRPLVTKAMGFASSNVCTFDADDTASSDSHTTITGAYGCLIYSDSLTTPVADQGICFNSFGASQGVVLGTFTIVWSGSGIFAITL